MLAAVARAVLVRRAHRDPLDLRDRRVFRGPRGRVGPLDHGVVRVHRGQLVLLPQSPAPWGLLVLKDHRASPGSLGLPVQPGRRVTPAMRVRSARRAQQDHQARRVPGGQWGKRGLLGRRAIRVTPAPPASKVPLAKQAPPARLGRTASFPALRVSVGRRDSRAIPASRAKPDRRASKAHPALKAHLVRRGGTARR